MSVLNAHRKSPSIFSCKSTHSVLHSPAAANCASIFVYFFLGCQLYFLLRMFYHTVLRYCIILLIDPLSHTPYVVFLQNPYYPRLNPVAYQTKSTHKLQPGSRTQFHLQLFDLHESLHRVTEPWAYFKCIGKRQIFLPFKCIGKRLVIRIR